MLQNMRKIAKRFTQRDALKTLNHFNYLHNHYGMCYADGYWFVWINAYGCRWRLRLS